MKIRFSSLILLGLFATSLTNCSHNTAHAANPVAYRDWFRAENDDEAVDGQALITEALVSCHYSDREIEDAWEQGDATGDYGIIDAVYDGDTDTLNNCEEAR